MDSLAKEFLGLSRTDMRRYILYFLDRGLKLSDTQDNFTIYNSRLRPDDILYRAYLFILFDYKNITNKHGRDYFKILKL